VPEENNSAEKYGSYIDIPWTGEKNVTISLAQADSINIQ
jgi:hypothetical protein